MESKTRSGEKHVKLLKDGRDNGKISESSGSLKKRLKEGEREERKNKKQESEKKEQKKNKEEKRTTTIREKMKMKEESSNKKKEEESIKIDVYEDDFEDYESDFEEDLEEREEAKDVRLEEEKGEESILRKKLTRNIEDEGINRSVDKEDIKERTFVRAISQEDREFSQRLIESRRKVQNNHEWFADYFKEVTGQNKYRKQVKTFKKFC